MPLARAAFSEGEASRACTAVAAALHGGRAGLARSGSVGEVVAGVGLLLAALAVSCTRSHALDCVQGRVLFLDPTSMYMCMVYDREVFCEFH